MRMEILVQWRTKFCTVNNIFLSPENNFNGGVGGTEEMY